MKNIILIILMLVVAIPLVPVVVLTIIALWIVSDIILLILMLFQPQLRESWKLGLVMGPVTLFIMMDSWVGSSAE